jgi:flagellar FliJ protein
MKKFNFRLEKVLDYRRIVEEWAKQAYLDARSKKLEAEAVLASIEAERAALLEQPILTVEDCQTLDLRLNLLEEKITHQKIAIEVLEKEEGDAFQEWAEKKTDVKVLEELRNRAYEEWKLEVSREEQAMLDEWSVQKRGAA